MDNDLIRDLFSHVIEASQILGVDAAFRGDITMLKGQLPPDQVHTPGIYVNAINWSKELG